jgi:hypothetical protein
MVGDVCFFIVLLGKFDSEGGTYICPHGHATGYFALGQARVPSANRSRLAKLGAVFPELARLENAEWGDDTGD